MTVQPTEDTFERLGLVCIDCPYPVASVGLERILESEAPVYVGREPQTPTSVIIFGVGGVEGVSEGMRRLRKHSPDALILVFGLYLDLAVARAALRSGARGFIHAGMQPDQIKRAVKMATEGEIVAPRQLLEYLISNEDVVDLNILSERQRQILELVEDGLTNAQVARKLYLTESTVKQHLRSAYKALGVKNRTEAVKLIREKAE